MLLLAHAFLRRLATEQGRRLSSWTRAAASALLAHRWPGNVRELQNVIERAVILEDSGRLSLASLPNEIRALATEPEDEGAASTGDPAPELPASADAVPQEPQAPGRRAPSTPEDVEDFDTQEKRIFEEALAACDWNIRDVSRRLAVGRATVYRKIEKYELDREGRLGSPGETT